MRLFPGTGRLHCLKSTYFDTIYESTRPAIEIGTIKGWSEAKKLVNRYRVMTPA